MNDQSLRLGGLLGGLKRGGVRWLRPLVMLAVWLAISGSGMAFAGTNVWTTTGPYGGQIRSLAIDPVVSTTVYAAGFGGVFKSVNGGSSWTAANTGFAYNDPHLVVNAVAVSRAAIHQSCTRRKSTASTRALMRAQVGPARGLGSLAPVHWRLPSTRWTRTKSMSPPTMPSTAAVTAAAIGSNRSAGSMARRPMRSPLRPESCMSAPTMACSRVLTAR